MDGWWMDGGEECKRRTNKGASGETQPANGSTKTPPDHHVLLVPAYPKSFLEIVPRYSVFLSAVKRQSICHYGLSLLLGGVLDRGGALSGCVVE
mmetsp:Transcript_14451/g.33378  ORF Transcript_14451/g.33378 Transcript_14451/m.33378 type:complete len:94 (-) Transcript_14451:352-633(-)